MNRDATSLWEIDLNEPPNGAQEAFLCSDITNLESDVALIGYVVFIVKRTIAKLDQEIQTLELRCRELTDWAKAKKSSVFMSHYGLVVGDSKPISELKAKAISECDPEYLEALSRVASSQQTLIDLRYRRDELAAYQEGLVTKRSVIPGLQGRSNRLDV